MVLRRYRSEDCREITELFYETVHKVNARDYRKEQLDVWATGQVDLAKWDQSLREHYSIVAVEDEKIVGFGDIDSAGYLDRLYVHAEHQGKGIATAICDELEHMVSGKITTHASITARPFFEKRGYHVVKEQKVERQGILLTNFVMEKVHVELKRNLKIALLQIAPCGTLEENLEKGIRNCREAKKLGADIALFPEMWSNGYNIYGRQVEKWKAEAIPADSDFVNAFGKLAQELNMAIGVTLLEAYGDAPRNSLVLFDRFGERKFVYAKVHTCDFDVERNLTPGEEFYVTELDMSCGTVKVGAMICYDREFPESARILMLKGAELILAPNACPMEINRLSQLRARAFENMTAIATCNYPETVPDCNGGSSVFDGVVYLPELEGSRDTCILQAGGEEGIYIAELDLLQLRTYRETEVHGNAYRRPKKYGELTEQKIERPFIRENYRE